MQLTNFAGVDAHDIVNALAGGPTVPAMLSVTAVWNSRPRFSDATNGFTTLFLGAVATLEWSATETGFQFVSDPADTSVTIYAAVARERNGVYFH